MPLAQLTKHNCRVRAGISLIEILMSIGIVGVGLMGVAALIPVANDYANKAIIRDRASELGQRAFREFKLRGFDQPGTLSNPFWFYPGGNITTIFYSTNRPNPPLALPNWESEQIVVQSYCFDPMHIASRLTSSLLPPSAQFPENSTLFAVHRVSAFSSRLDQLYPGVVARNLLSALSNDLSNSNPARWPVIHTWQADTVSTLQDDLVYQSPENEELASFQEFRTYDHDGKAATPPVRNARLNQGDFSWMATIVPEFEVRAGATPYAFRKSDNYNLSIAVFHRRVVNDLQKPVQEIIAPVIPPSAGSYTSSGMGSSTKEFQIQLPVGTYNPNQGATFDEMQPGDWIIIGQDILGVGVRTLKWMKVASTPEVSTVSGNANYLFTATGSDLNYFMQGPGGGMLPIPTYAIYIRNVVNVYEKTVRLQSSSGYEN